MKSKWQIQVCLNLNDFGLSKHLFFKQYSREPECTRIIKHKLKKGTIIVEIGVNIGYYALLEASIICEQGKIYAISTFQFLKD